MVFLDTNILLCEFDLAYTIEQFTRDRSDLDKGDRSRSVALMPLRPLLSHVKLFSNYLDGLDGIAKTRKPLYIYI